MTMYKTLTGTKVFDNKEDLIKHILENEVMTVESDLGIKIHNLFTEQFPEANVSVESVNGTYGEYFVRVMYNVHDWDFYVGDYTEECYENQQFENEIEAVNYYNMWFIFPINSIKRNLESKYSVSRFEVINAYDCDIDSNRKISFELKLDDKEIEIDYDFQGIDLFLKQINSYFVKTIEGMVVNEVEHDYLGKHVTLTVDDIDVNSFLKDGKHVRITLLD